MPPSQVRIRVDEIMALVDLEDIAYCLVGDLGVSGLSLEQRKRLTIANEMVGDPAVIFMDEPTSGECHGSRYGSRCGSIHGWTSLPRVRGVYLDLDMDLDMDLDLS